jgi:hypothetical protein
VNHAALMRTEEAATDAAETTEDLETIEEPEMTDAVGITEAAITAEIIPIIVTGIVLNVTTLTSHSEPNVIDVESPRVPVHPTSSVTIEAAETTVVEETTVEEEMTEEEAMIEEIIAVIIQATIGIVLNVTTLTSHSELNVTAVENLRVKADLTNAMIGAVVTTEEVEMTAEVETTGVAETTDVEEIINAVEMTVETILTTIGNAENVRTPTSHSEQNVTAVVHLKVVEKEHLPITGKVMTEDLETGEESKPPAQETGIARNVESLILLREMTASVVDVPRE